MKVNEVYDYRGSHTAPDRTNGAPLHDLETAFPGIYGPNALQYYKTGGNDADDAITLHKIQRLHNKPRAGVQIYRAVPRGVRTINPGDWVAINKNYAVEHGAGQLRNAYRILTKVVSARDLYNNGDSIQEFGYDPEGK